MTDFLMLALLAAAFAATVGYIRVCSVLVDGGDALADNRQ
jgi:hypothetical protein